MSEPQISLTQSPALVPRHVAIIMDGNHRWAKRKFLPGAAGHQAGARNVRHVAELCADLGVEYLTLFAFSTENWNRPQREIDLLMRLMRGMLENDVEELHAKGVRLRIIGDRSKFSAEIQLLMARAEQVTRLNDRLYLTIAANYGGRWDIARAAREMAMAVERGELDPRSVDEDTFENYLSMRDLPHPDLCIRTGGDRRISNFLLWDLAYTELYFTDAYWPEFDEMLLESALSDYQGRQRRFGRRTA
ncbi:MAG: polyprenyl diphosphate synthase [Pseudomonadota bacterium]|nr:polyprenyl diphosphate synthase [Pseudomonadota bacterium]